MMCGNSAALRLIFRKKSIFFCFEILLPLYIMF